MTVSKRFLALALVLVFAAPVAVAAPHPAAQRQLEFRVCRTPGLETAGNSQPIEVPAGTEYDESHSALAEASGLPPETRRAALAVVTTGAATLPANSYCVTVSAKPRGTVDPSVLRASVGAMFEPDHSWRDLQGHGAIDLTYGYWRSAED
jgi:hypothetical protein